MNWRIMQVQAAVEQQASAFNPKTAIDFEKLLNVRWNRVFKQFFK